MQLDRESVLVETPIVKNAFIKSHNNYATNQSTSHPLQCNERKSPFYTASIGSITPKKRIQRNRLSLLYPKIRRSGKHRLGCCSVRYYTINYLLQPFTPFTLIFHSNLSLVRTPDFAWCLYSSIGLRPTTVLSVGQRWMG